MFARIIKIAMALIMTSALVAGGSAAALAAAGPFLPGDPLFGVQSAAEQTWAALTINPGRHAAVLLQLADRRLRNLYVRRGTEYELAALAYLDAAANEVMAAIAAAPPESTPQLRARLATLAGDMLAVLDTLTVLPASNPDVYANARAKAQTIQMAASDPNFDLLQLTLLDIGLPADMLAGGNGLLDSPRAVPFPPNSTAAAHQFFPLTGKHAALACSDCHTTSQYKGTPGQCADCHASATPANHFEGDCAGCHTSMGWKPATFNHAGATDCAACHADDKPGGHFEGQCSNCHAADSWTNVRMDHAGLTDCLACHTMDAPANHFGGQCDLCHSVVTWTGAIFDHSAIGSADCSTCHTGRAPASHYGTPCAACHRGTSNWENVSFDHGFAVGVDCADCHANRAPASHYGTPCAACHRDTSNWKNAGFDHSQIGGADCSQCHAPPSNHYPGSCRACHGDTGNFRNASFSHPWFNVYHEGANGACANCHPGNNYSTTDCQTCHDANGEGGEDGDSGEHDGGEHDEGGEHDDD